MAPVKKVHLVLKESFRAALTHEAMEDSDIVAE